MADYLPLVLGMTRRIQTGSQSRWGPRPWWRPWRGVLIGFALAFLAGIGVATLAGSREHWNHGFAWERALMIRLHAPLPDGIDSMVLALTWFGTNLVLLPAVGVMCWWLWVRCRRPDAAARLTAVQLGSYLLNPSLKALYERPRPAMFVRRGWYAWSSYPSGHAIATVSVLITIALLLHDVRGWRWPFYIVIPIGFASIYSRLYLGVHWPTDVIAGIIVGAVWLGVTMYAFRDRRPASPEERRKSRGVDVATADDGGDALTLS